MQYLVRLEFLTEVTDEEHGEEIKAFVSRALRQARAEEPIRTAFAEWDESKGAQCFEGLEMYWEEA